MTDPTADVETEIAAIEKLTADNQAKINELARNGVQIQHNVPMAVLLDLLLGDPRTGTIQYVTGVNPRLAYERRVQELLAEQLDAATAQVMSQLRQQQLMAGVHSQGVPADVAKLIVPGR